MFQLTNRIKFRHILIAMAIVAFVFGVGGCEREESNRSVADLQKTSLPEISRDSALTKILELEEKEVALKLLEVWLRTEVACKSYGLPSFAEPDELNERGLLPFTFFNVKTNSPFTSNGSDTVILPGNARTKIHPVSENAMFFFNDSDDTVSYTEWTFLAPEQDSMNQEVRADFLDADGQVFYPLATSYSLANVRRKPDQAQLGHRNALDVLGEKARKLSTALALTPDILEVIGEGFSYNLLFEQDSAERALEKYGIHVGNSSFPFDVQFHYGEEVPDNIFSRPDMAGTFHVYLWNEVRTYGYIAYFESVDGAEEFRVLYPLNY